MAYVRIIKNDLETIIPVVVCEKEQLNNLQKQGYKIYGFIERKRG